MRAVRFPSLVQRNHHGSTRHTLPSVCWAAAGGNSTVLWHFQIILLGNVRERDQVAEGRTERENETNSWKSLRLASAVLLLSSPAWQRARGLCRCRCDHSCAVLGLVPHCHGAGAPPCHRNPSAGTGAAASV